MTLTSGSILADALIASLVAQSASTFNSASDKGNITKNDFGLMDTTTSGCVYMVHPPAFELVEHTYGELNFMRYAFRIRCMVRDTGNSVETLNKLYRADIDLRAAVNADDSLGGSAMHAHITRCEGWNGETFVQSQNSTIIWIPLDFTLEAELVG